MQEVRAAVIGTGVMGRKYAQMIAEGKDTHHPIRKHQK